MHYKKFNVFSEAFGPGDSGSIIFTESRADDGTLLKRYALGMLRGTPPVSEGKRYEAIYLDPSLRELVGFDHFTTFTTRPSQPEN